MKKMFLGACALALLASVPAKALSRYEVIIINDTGGSAITSIYAYNLETNRNKGDVLPGVVEYGSSKRIDLDDGSGSCMWRLQAELANDAKTPWKVHNICKLNSWTITQE